MNVVPQSLHFLASLLVVFLAALAPPSSAQAAEFRYDEEGTVQVAEDESIDDTVFLAGETVIVAGVVQGDVFAAAERVEVTGTIHGNLYCAGESIRIAGEVSGNVHAAGQTVEVDARVNGSSFVAGQDVTTTEGSELSRGGFLAGETVLAKGRVGRDLYFAAETMEVTGNVVRSVHGYAAQFRVGPGASIEENIVVTVPSEDAAKIDDAAAVKGAKIVEIAPDHEPQPFSQLGFYLGILIKTLALLLFGVVAVALFPSLRPPAPESSNEALRQAGIGFLVLLATPVAVLLVAVTLIGIPVAIVLAIAYALLLYASTLVVADLAGQRLAVLGRGGQVLRTGFSLLVILLLMELPFVGPVLHFLVHIFGMGCLAMHWKGLYDARRRGPTSATMGSAEALTP